MNKLKETTYKYPQKFSLSLFNVVRFKRELLKLVISSSVKFSFL